MADETIDDVACTVCACVCDDLRLTVRDGRIIAHQPNCSLIENWFSQQNSLSGPAATHEGRELSLDAAIQQAAQILQAARSPLIYGLSRSSTDGQRAAVALADRLGASIDTTASEGHAPSILALQQVGESTCSLGEIRNRADLIIYWGSDPDTTHPRHRERYLPANRKLVVIDSQNTKTAANADHFITIDDNSDFEAIWVLRSLLRGIEPNRATTVNLPMEQLRDLAERMKSCRCGIVFFGYGLVRQPLGNHNVQALLQLVTDLNQYTRFYARRMRVAGDVSGADSVLCWQTGYPFSVNFARGYPRYGPGEYSAADLLERGEVDAVMLIGSSRLETFSDTAIRHLSRIKTILLEHPFGAVPFEPTIRITTAIYGIHRHGAAYRMDEVPIPLRPLIPSADPSDAEVLQSIYKLIFP